MSFDEKKKYGSMDKAFQAGKKDKAKTWNETIQGIVKAQESSSRTKRALSKPFIIQKDDFYGTPFNTLLASGDGKRLWYSVTFEPSGAKGVYKIEKLSSDNDPTVVKDFDQAVNVFNSM